MAKGESYEEFIEKFKPKKTTDDCMTPPAIYDAVAEWVATEYGLDRSKFVRPFWPGGDYERFDYPADCVVVDNPPFSILAKITRDYLRRGIRFFLFAPTLTLFSGHEQRACYIPCGVTVTYENGAKVNTSFVTSLDGYQLRTAPSLYQAVKQANDVKFLGGGYYPLPKYQYPPEVLTSAAAYQYGRMGVDLRIMPEECVFIRALDAQRKYRKSIFGSGLLLSERAAAERAAYDNAIERDTPDYVWELSQREKDIVEGLTNH